MSERAYVDAVVVGVVIFLSADNLPAVYPSQYIVTAHDTGRPQATAVSSFMFRKVQCQIYACRRKQAKRGAVFSFMFRKVPFIRN